MANMGEAVLTQSDPLRSGGYIRQKTNFPSENLYHRRLTFPVKRVIKLDEDKCLLDGLRYSLMPKKGCVEYCRRDERRETATGPWSRGNRITKNSIGFDQRDTESFIIKQKRALNVNN